MPRPPILMIQPTLQPPGGGNGVCAWMLQALREDYDLTLLAWEPVDFGAVNRYFGTSLQPADLSIQLPDRRLRRLLALMPLPLVDLKKAVLFRAARGLTSRYAAAMTADGEADFGRPGVQYVHYPVRHVAPLPKDMRWIHQRPLLAAYERIRSLIQPFDDESMRTNLTLVNSSWTGQLVARTHGIPVRVVHPPAAGDFPDIAWADREPGFLCVGRLSPEKNIETVVAIVRRVRERYPAAHLHLVGSDDRAAYARQVRSVAQAAGPWVTVEGTVSVERLAHLLATHRYAIHGMAEEHFGISVAQAVRAGCIVFVPDGGGQVEIVERDPALCYTSPGDAVDKITRVLSDETLQQQIRGRLAAQAARFTPEYFMAEIRRVAAEAVERARQRQTHTVK